MCVCGARHAAVLEIHEADVVANHRQETCELARTTGGRARAAGPQAGTHRRTSRRSGTAALSTAHALPRGAAAVASRGGEGTARRSPLPHTAWLYYVLGHMQ